MWVRSGMGDQYGDPSFVGPPDPGTFALQQAEQGFLMSSGRAPVDTGSGGDWGAVFGDTGPVQRAAASFRPWPSPIHVVSSGSGGDWGAAFGDTGNILQKTATAAVSSGSNALTDIAKAFGFGKPSAPSSSVIGKGGDWGAIIGETGAIVDRAIAAVTPGAAVSSKKGAPAAAGSPGSSGIMAAATSALAPFVALASGGGKKSPGKPAKGRRGAAPGMDLTPWLYVGGAAAVVLGLVMIARRN